MSANFAIEYKKSNGNLHVRPRGDFDGSSAWELVHLLHDKYAGQGRIFVDTRALREVCPFGCNIFRCQLNPRRVPLQQLYFKGEKGFDLAPRGSRVIVGSGHQCRGDCRNCACRKPKNG